MMQETTQEKIERLYKEGNGTWSMRRSIMIETGASRKTVNDTIWDIGRVQNLKWYTKSKSGSDFDLGAPYKVMKDTLVRGKYKWTIYGTRQNVSATVIERCVSAYWSTKRDATLVLRNKQDEMAL
jgi:hypothetical protein